jgi:hypothetical protein
MGNKSTFGSSSSLKDLLSIILREEDRFTLIRVRKLPV